jgi:hypothetical protein
MVSDMDEARKNSIIARAYRTIESVSKQLSEPRPAPPTGWTPWQPRQVSAPERNPEPVNAEHVPHLPESMLSRQIAAYAADQRDKARISECLGVLADEAGAAAGRLQKQVSELQKQLDTLKAASTEALNELRGEISLLRGVAAAEIVVAQERRTN